MESGDSIESDDGIVRFRDYLSVKNMYYDWNLLKHIMGNVHIVELQLI